MINRLMALALLAFSFTLVGQDIRGFKGGAAFSRVVAKDKNGFKLDGMPGLYAGALWVFEQSESVAIKTEVMLAGRGVVSRYEDRVESLETREWFYYLEMPLLLEFSSRGEGTQWKFNFGPYGAVGLFGRWNAAYDDGSGVMRDKGDVVFAASVNEDNLGRFDQNDIVLRMFDFGANVGVGLSWEKFGLEFTYSRGLVSTVPEVDLDGVTFKSSKIYNQSLRLGIVYKIPMERNLSPF